MADLFDLIDTPENGTSRDIFDSIAPPSPDQVPDEIAQSKAQQEIERNATAPLWLGKALGHAQDVGKEAFSGMLPPEMMQTIFGGSESSLRPEERSKPLISLAASKELAGQLPAWAGGNTQLGQGLSESTANALSSFSTPGALAQLPAFAVPGVAETYALNVLSETPDQGKKLLETADKYGWASKETGQVAGEYGITDLTAFLAGRHGTLGRYAETARDIRRAPDVKAGEVPKVEGSVSAAPNPETQELSGVQGQTEPSDGSLWYQGVGPEGATTWVTSNFEKAKIYASRRGAGGKINVYTPDQIGESAFADQDGNLLSPQEYAKTQSQDTTIQALGRRELPQPTRTIPLSEASPNPSKTPLSSAESSLSERRSFPKTRAGEVASSDVVPSTEKVEPSKGYGESSSLDQVPQPEITPPIVEPSIKEKQDLGKPEPQELTAVQGQMEPPVQSGMVRLYHGASEGAGQAGTDFTPSREYAQGYAGKSQNGQVWYVDVPKDSPFLVRDEGNAIPGQEAPLINGQKLPDEIANKAKPLTATGEPNAVPIRSTAEEIPSPIERGENQQVSGERVRPSEQGQEVAGTGQIPEESKTTGIAQRVHERRGVEVAPGEGIGAEDQIKRGRNLISEGVDPNQTLAQMKASGRINADDISVLRARHEELGRVTNAAEDAMRSRPNDPVARRAYDAAWQTETNWAKEIKPFQTEWHKIGMAQQGEVDIDTGTFTGLRRAVFQEKGRDVKPHEVGPLRQVADKVQAATAAEALARKRLSDAVKQITRKSVPHTAEELRNHFANRIRKLTPC